MFGGNFALLGGDVFCLALLVSVPDSLAWWEFILRARTFSPLLFSIPPLFASVETGLSALDGGSSCCYCEFLLMGRESVYRWRADAIFTIITMVSFMVLRLTVPLIPAVLSVLKVNEAPVSGPN